MALIDNDKMIAWMLHAFTNRSRSLTIEKQ